MLFVCLLKILRKHCFQFLLGPFQLTRETEDNAYAKFWGDKQGALCYGIFWSGQLINQVNNQRLTRSTDMIQLTLPLNWVPHRLSKRQSLSTTVTVLFRTTITRTIMLHLLIKWLLDSNLSQYYFSFIFMSPEDFERSLSLKRGIIQEPIIIKTKSSFSSKIWRHFGVRATAFNYRRGQPHPS